MLVLALSPAEPHTHFPWAVLEQNTTWLRGSFLLLGIIVCVPVLLVFGPNSCWTFASFLCAPLLFLDVHARVHSAASDSNSSSISPSSKLFTRRADVAAEEDQALGDLRRRKLTTEDDSSGHRQGKEELLVDLGHSWEGEAKLERSSRPSLSVSGVIVWAFFAILFFYKSGHLCDFSSLQFESPFIGILALMCAHHRIPLTPTCMHTLRI